MAEFDEQGANALVNIGLNQDLGIIYDNIINGVNYDATMLAATALGGAADRVVVPMVINDYTQHLWDNDAAQTKLVYVRSVCSNSTALQAAGLTAADSAVVSILRATAIVKYHYPATAQQAGLPVSEITYTASNATLVDLRDPYLAIIVAAKTIYPNIVLLANDYVNYLHIANLNRKSQIHLMSTVASFTAKWNRIAVSVRGASGSQDCMKLTPTLFRYVYHAFGFRGLVQPCQDTINQCAEPIRMRANCVYSGSALVPTTYAVLVAFTGSTIPGTAGLEDYVVRLRDAKDAIYANPIHYAVHRRFYENQPTQPQPELELAHRLAPMLAGWLRTLSANSTLKAQQVITKASQVNPEDVETWERLILAYRRNLQQTGVLADALVSFIAGLP